MSRGSVVKEIKITLTGERQEFVSRVLDRSANHVVVLYPIRARRRVAGLVLPRGAVTYGYFWRDRPYNVYHWMTAGGRTLGFYVNLADRVTFRPGVVEWQDLAVDLLFSPDGSRVQILDEAEAALAPPEIRTRIEAARIHVLQQRDELLAEVAAATALLRRKGRVPSHRGEESGRRPRTP